MSAALPSAAPPAAPAPVTPAVEQQSLPAAAVQQPSTAAAPPVKKPATKKAAAEGDLIIPKGSVKRVIKLDKDVRLVASDAVLVLTKATELFLQKLGMASFEIAKEDSRKMVKYGDVVAARAADDNMEFLDGIVPPPKSMPQQ